MKAQHHNILRAFIFFCFCMYLCGTPYLTAAATDNKTTENALPRFFDERISQPGYIVKQGDCLGKILREEFKLPDAIIFSPQTTLAIQKANPHIQNINDLHTGEKLFVPAQILQPGQKTTMSSVAEQAGTLPSLPEKNPGGKIKTSRGLANILRSDEQEPHAIHLSTDETTITEASLVGADALLHEKKTRALLLDFTKALGGYDNTTCIKILPIENGGTLVMDCSQFPLYEYPWGSRIILDYGDQMPAPIRKIISEQWDHTEIITAAFNEDAEAFFARAIDGCGLHKLESGNRYIVNRNNIQISVSGNWIVYKENAQKNIFVISLSKDSSQIAPDSLGTYLAGMGINWVHLNTTENQPKTATPILYTPVNEFTQVQTDPVHMTDMILDLLGISYQKNIKTKIIPHNAQGIKFEVTIDRKFELAGKTCFIDFKNLSSSIADMLTNNGYKILQINLKNTDLIKSMQELLVFCAVHNSSSPVQLQYDQSEKASIKINIPGFLIHSKSGDILLTNSDIDKNTLVFLSEIDIRAVKF